MRPASAINNNHSIPPSEPVKQETTQQIKQESEGGASRMTATADKGELRSRGKGMATNLMTANKKRVDSGALVHKPVIPPRYQSLPFFQAEFNEKNFLPSLPIDDLSSVGEMGHEVPTGKGKARSKSFANVAPSVPATPNVPRGFMADSRLKFSTIKWSPSSTTSSFDPSSSASSSGLRSVHQRFVFLFSKSGSFPLRKSFAKGTLEEFSGVLMGKGIKVGILEDIKQVIDGMTMYTEPTGLSPIATTQSRGEGLPAQPTMNDVIEGVIASFNKNFGKEKKIALASPLIAKLLEATDTNNLSFKATFSSIENVVNLWKNIGDKLKENGVGQPEIVKIREQIITQRNTTERKLQTIGNIVQFYFFPKIYEGMMLDNDRADGIEDSNPTIEEHVQNQISKLNRDRSPGVPTLMEVEGIRESVEKAMVDNHISRDSVAKNPGNFDAISGTIKDAIIKTWSDQEWLPIKTLLSEKGVPEVDIASLRAFKVNAIQTAPHITEFMKMSESAGAGFKQAWALKGGVAEANKLGVKENQLGGQDAQNIQVWLSNFLQKVIAYEREKTHQTDRR